MAAAFDDTATGAGGACNAARSASRRKMSITSRCTGKALPLSSRQAHTRRRTAPPASSVHVTAPSRSQKKAKRRSASSPAPLHKLSVSQAPSRSDLYAEACGRRVGALPAPRQTPAPHTAASSRTSGANTCSSSAATPASSRHVHAVAVAARASVLATRRRMRARTQTGRSRSCTGSSSSMQTPISAAQGRALVRRGSPGRGDGKSPGRALVGSSDRRSDGRRFAKRHEPFATSTAARASRQNSYPPNGACSLCAEPRGRARPGGAPRAAHRRRVRPRSW